MIPIFYNVLKIALIVAAAIWVADRSGHVRIEWEDSLIETSTALLVGVIAILLFAAVTITRLVEKLRASPKIYRMQKALKHHQKGHQLLGQALDAISLEKNNHAVKLLKRAEKLLGPSHVVDLVKSHNDPENQVAASHKADFSSPYAWREAIEHQTNNQKFDEARNLANRFIEKHPNLALPRKLLFDVYAREGKWDKAVATLDQMRMMNAMPRKDIRYTRAALFTQRAINANGRGNSQEAFEWAMQADRLHPKWVPSLVQATKALIGQNKHREAATLIAQNWRESTHDQLADLFLTLKHFKDGLRAAQEAEKIARKNENHEASHWLQLNAYVLAKLYGQARVQALKLVDIHPSRKVFMALARIEEAEDSNRAAANAWRKKAEDAHPDECWVCQDCKQPHNEWQALCRSCNHFNSLHWGHPLHATQQIEKKPA